MTVFKATHVINFAQGSVLLLGAFVIGRTHELARLLAGGARSASPAAAAGRGADRRRADPAASGAPTSARWRSSRSASTSCSPTELTRQIGTDVLSIGAPWGSNVVEFARHPGRRRRA